MHVYQSSAKKYSDSRNLTNMSGKTILAEASMALDAQRRAHMSSPKQKIGNRTSKFTSPSYDYTQIYQQTLAPPQKTFTTKKVSNGVAA